MNLVLIVVYKHFPERSQLGMLLSLFLCYILFVSDCCLFSSVFNFVIFSKLIGGGNFKALFWNKLDQDCVKSFAANEG